MDAASVSAQSLGNIQAKASIYTFRKALDIEQSTMQQLLAAIPQVAPVSNPTATVGRNIDTVA